MPESYLEWNDVIAARIFRPEMAGRQVFLYVNDDLIEEIGGTGSVPEFVSAVETGPPWAPSNLGLCQKALRALEGWRDRNLDYPPYLAYLALFVLAVGIEGPFATHAYYPRLRTLLRWPDIDAGQPPSFERMLQLWEDLEVWSNHDANGALGVSNIRIAGEWIHVGLPKAQALLTEQELHALPSIFAAAGFDPTAPPPDVELARSVRRFGANLLRQPTLDLLSSRTQEPEELLAALLDTIRSELEEWDGEVATPTAESARAVSALARLCIKVDEIAGRVTSTLRVAANAEFPEEGLTLVAQDGGLVFSSQEYLPGWSSTLKDAVSGREIGGTEFSWSEAQLLRDSEAGWQVRLPAARIRIFVRGLPFDLPGFVEVRRLAANRPFILAADAAVSPALDRWRESGQVDLHQIDVLDGLPAGWSLYRSAGASSDKAVRHEVPELALPAAVRVTLRGGIRSGHGATFFRFAPPTVVVDGSSGNELVICEGKRLTPVEDSGFFTLPEGLPTDERITVEIQADGEVVRRQSLFLSDDFPWRLSERLASFDRFGLQEPAAQADASGPVITGARVSPDAETAPFAIRCALPTGRRVYAIGRHPGQIRRLPAQPFPSEWNPVWMVELERKGHATYCGNELDRSSPSEATDGNADEVDLWKEILWRRRKRVAPPDHPLLRKLWTSYVEAGSRV